MTQNLNRTKSTELALLFLLFILPGCLAALLYQHPQWLVGQTSNKGQLVSPLIKLDSLTQKKWHLLLVSDQQCSGRCLAMLDKLARVRLALGRLSREVDLRLMVTDPSLLPDKIIQNQMKDMAMTSQILSSTDRENLSIRNYLKGLFIVDPHNFMVLYYPLNAQQKSIFKDLKHLIKLAEQ
ncbi:hypothetical protein [Legionella sp. W05-934-2]|jgi:hypothetical protein|uniref:hypothetical protein n=1 Tax=Legionella sp. W05-934-2 TaxID=1198649 RepID=UPI003461F373